MEVYSAYTDDVLVDLLQQHDRRAYSMIYKRYFDRLYIHAFGMLKDEYIAADVVQDVFIYLWDHRMVRIRVSLSAYLYSCTRHAVLKVIRRCRVADRFRAHIAHLSETALPMTDDVARLRELQTIIEAEISKLPDRMREVFELRYRADHSNQEIADFLGISKHTVKNHVVNSLRILRSRLNRFIFLLLIFSLLIFLSAFR